MTRTNRIALLAAIALILAVSGTVLATRAPNSPAQPAQDTQDEEDTPPTAEELATTAQKLRDAGLEVNDAELADLAATYGMGGAVRIIAWSQDPDVGLSVADIRERRDGTETEPGMGWGRIAKELGVSPGLGSIMGNGGGHGRDNAPGQNRDEGDASGG